MIEAVDAHAEGEPGRLVFGGTGRLAVPGATMFEKKMNMERDFDWLRLFMLKEPRGLPSTCMNVILPTTDPRADFGVVIIEQTPYYPPMSGSNTMCIVTVMLETGRLPMVEPQTHLVMETPAGLVEVTADCHNGRVTRVTFDNVPSFATHLDVKIDVPGLGEVMVDVAYGGMFYVMANADELGIDLVPENGDTIATAGERIKAAARDQLQVVHPLNPEINVIENGILYGAPKDPANSARNAVIVSTGAISSDPEINRASIDRSPCGTGTSARLAVLRAKGQIEPRAEFRNESLLGGIFTGTVVSESEVGDYAAIVPRISGRAWISGYATYVCQNDDPYPLGFTVGDIWAPQE
ncbi:proline racemase family protein [Acrocarpospora catenulata]|uniref:proline racemase family protein n=1 Tax=Acrocarpospora catenulata TaxID=2836182 RepID=UPI001BDB3A55|nr:proline racemase family protein [Acrocarpospora catenulata]